MPIKKSGTSRASITIGCTVDVIQKADQLTGRKTRGIVEEILTGSPTHPHGIKVRLKAGQVGRVAEVLEEANPDGKKPS